jgi:putative transposase
MILGLPRYARGKEVRRGYARYRFLKVQGLPPVVYGLEWVTVRLPVLYRGGERVRTRVEEELLREEGLVLRSLLLLYSVLGGKLNAKLWTQELEVRGDFKYVVVDGKYVKLRGGRRGVLIALGLTDHGVRAVLWS